MPGASYRGDVTVEAAWAALGAEPDAVLIDVRTEAEWAYVGVPSLDEFGKTPIFIEWQMFPTGDVKQDFAGLVQAELEERGIDREASLFFICRSGSRSRSAAIAVTAGGFANCFNIGPGFEGPLNGDRHRSAVSGWRVAGLPWSQT